MKKILLFLTLVLLISCSAPEDDREIVGFIGGVNGLGFSLLEGSPPPVVTDGATQPFSVAVAIENVGESDVGPGTENPFVLARLSGLNQENPEMFGLEKENLTMRMDRRLLGARKNVDGTILPGEIATLIFQGLNFQYKVVGSEQFLLRVDTCYDYATHSTLQVCVKDDIIEHIQDDSLCSLRSDLSPRNSGAPLHVTKADQNPIGDSRIQINFEIENLAGGMFFNRNDNSPFGSCYYDLRNPDAYKALLVVEPVDPVNYNLNCRGLDNTKQGFERVSVPEGSNYGVISMRNNVPKSMTCFMEKKTDVGERVFQDMMNIHIYYRYGGYVDVPILVQEASGYGSETLGGSE